MGAFHRYVHFRRVYASTTIQILKHPIRFTWCPQNFHVQMITNRSLRMSSRDWFTWFLRGRWIMLRTTGRFLKCLGAINEGKRQIRRKLTRNRIELRCKIPNSASFWKKKVSLRRKLHTSGQIYLPTCQTYRQKCRWLDDEYWERRYSCQEIAKPAKKWFFTITRTREAMRRRTAQQTRVEENKCGLRCLISSNWAKM